jgi:hypothetical protein
MNRIILAAVIVSIFLLPVRSQPQDIGGRVFWKGMVDAKVQLIIKGDKIETKTPEGRAYPDGTYSFTTPLPKDAVRVSVTKTEGRGSVAVAQQPAVENDFTSIVEITDPKGGAKEYQLEIFWE